MMNCFYFNIFRKCRTHSFVCDIVSSIFIGVVVLKTAAKETSGRANPDIFDSVDVAKSCPVSYRINQHPANMAAQRARLVSRHEPFHLWGCSISIMTVFAVLILRPDIFYIVRCPLLLKTSALTHGRQQGQGHPGSC